MDDVEVATTGRLWYSLKDGFKTLKPMVAKTLVMQVGNHILGISVDAKRSETA
jgi:hypothetical protein